MRPTILCANPQQAVTATVAVGIRKPGRVWIEFERDRCRKIVYRSVCYGVIRPSHRQVAANYVCIGFPTVWALRNNTPTTHLID